MPAFKTLAKGAFRAIRSALSNNPEDAIYLPKIGGSHPIRGPFDDRTQDVDPDTQQQISSNVFSFGFLLDDLPVTPLEGDKIKIENVTYHVVDCIEDGVPGVSVVLILHKDC